MPFINTKTNIEISPDKELSLKDRLGKAISALPGKSESWLMLNFEDKCRMYFRGDDKKPIVFVNVMVYGSADSASFNKLTGKITDIFNSELGISPDCIYVKYEEVENWGWNGSDF